MLPYVLGKLVFIKHHWREQYYGRFATWFGASEKYDVLSYIVVEFV